MYIINSDTNKNNYTENGYHTPFYLRIAMNKYDTIL